MVICREHDHLTTLHIFQLPLHISHSVDGKSNQLAIAALDAPNPTHIFRQHAIIFNIILIGLSSTVRFMNKKWPQPHRSKIDQLLFRLVVYCSQKFERLCFTFLNRLLWSHIELVERKERYFVHFITSTHTIFTVSMDTRHCFANCGVRQKYSQYSLFAFVAQHIDTSTTTKCKTFQTYKYAYSLAIYDPPEKIRFAFGSSAEY